MSATYLSRIELQEFRSFSKLVVDLPPQPGVLIVHGSNGLGKSSLFDGIEWTLTSEIDHFRSARSAPPAHYLRRWEARDDHQTYVQLDFGDHRIRRSLSGKLESTGGTSVTAFLQRSDWGKPIGHLGRYLLLTHFLGQSTDSRMTHREPKERWEFLQAQEPASSDRAIQIVRGLHGHGGSKIARAFERRSAELVAEAEQLERLLRDEEQQWRDAQLEGAIDDEIVQREARRVYGVLRELLSRLHGPVDGVPKDPLDPLEDAIILNSEVPDALLRFEERLARGRTHLRERQHAEVELLGVQAALKSLQEQVGLFRTGYVEIQGRQLRADSVLAQTLSEHRAALEAVSAVADYERIREAQSRLHMELTGRTALADKLVREVEGADAEVRKAERRRAVSNQLLRKRTEANEEFERGQVVLDKLSKAEVAADALREATVRLASLTAGSDDLGKRIAALVQQRQAADRRVEASGAMLAETQRSVGAMSAAVATIAAELPAEICDCPVCSTRFSSGGALRDRIGAAVERLAPAVAAFEADFRAAVDYRDQTQLRLAVLVGHAKEIEECRSEVADLTSRLDKLQGAIAAIGETSEDRLSDLRATLEVAANRFTIQMRRADRWLNHKAVGGGPAATASWARAIEARNGLAASLAEARNEIERVNTSLKAATGELNGVARGLGIAHDAPSAVVTGLRSERLFRVRAAEASLASARENVQVLQSEESSANARLAQLDAQSAELRSQADFILVQLTRLDDEWERLKLDLPQMSAEALEVSFRQLPGLQREIQSVGQEIQKLRNGRLAWTRQERHHAKLSEMRSLAGMLPFSDRNSLRRALSDKQLSLIHRSEAVFRAKRIAQQANAEVSDRVVAFYGQFLAPLSSLMARISRAILSDPEIGLDLKVELNKIEQRAIVRSNLPAYVNKLDPLLVHSEGQMAALAVSMLTAASLTFPWSRWPALVLDDPLQHNDIVHAAGFADMLRNLILAHRYQILLSTHDPTQAEFLRRKFQAAEIPCTTVHLVGRGAQGVEARITKSGIAQT